MLFHLSLFLITFGGYVAHLAYHLHKSGRKTPIIIIFQNDGLLLLETASFRDT